MVSLSPHVSGTSRRWAFQSTSSSLLISSVYYSKGYVHMSYEGSCRVEGAVSDAQMLFLCLRSGTFCECRGSGDASYNINIHEVSPKTWVLTLLCFLLGKLFFGRSHSWNLPRVREVLSILNLDHLLLFGSIKNVLRWVLVLYHLGGSSKSPFSYTGQRQMSSLYFSLTHG